ncbi:phospholipase [Rhodobacteraceae bacterium NNCM2]|nr:phospholipase [Coraliihabitans acroporae]
MTGTPQHETEALTPLITGAEAFPALERLAAGARRRLWLGFRVFDPDTRLRGDGAAGETWADLLSAKLDEGVEIRILLADFDALARAELHRGAWASAAKLSSLEGRGGERIEVLPALHPAAVRGIGRYLLQPAAFFAARHRQNELNALDPDARRAALDEMPGLWRALRLDEAGRVRLRANAMPRLSPATLHQKIAVADGKHAVIGGIDVDERRFDDPDHQRPAADTWHDVSMEVRGAVAADIAGHFAETWNRCSHAMAPVRARQKLAAPPGGGVLARLRPTSPCPVPKRAPAADEGGARLLRTVSRRAQAGESPLIHHAHIREIEAAHFALIERAERQIYIETQFFRSRPIARALALAARRNPALELVMILPAAPEDVAFKGRNSLAERFGDWLQTRCLDQVTRAFGDRAAILSPARPVAEARPGRHRLYGAEMIYVHAKVAMRDEDEAIVSSANLNGRSLRWDTEAGLHMTRPDDVRRLGLALRGHWLGEANAHVTGAPVWAAMAEADSTLTPERRKGLLLPHRKDPAREAAVPVPGAPEELV